MSFYGCQFSFDGIPCYEFGLMMYSFDSKSNDSSDSLSVNADIIEDRISRRYSPLHYGVTKNKPLEFTLTFGADITSIEKDVHLDRWDLNAISNWLTAHDTYKVLEITQPDMETFRYKCFIRDLKKTSIAGVPWAMTCNVLCDSPFAYLQPEHYSYVLNGDDLKQTITNRGSYHGFYKPFITLEQDGGDFSICNTTDDSRTMAFINLPTVAKKIYIDTENEVITCVNDPGINLYKYFNFNFLRLQRGINNLVLNGSGKVEIICEFPVSIGG